MGIGFCTLCNIRDEGAPSYASDRIICIVRLEYSTHFGKFWEKKKPPSGLVKIDQDKRLVSCYWDQVRIVEPAWI